MAISFAPVTPCVGVWIEICPGQPFCCKELVTPCVGVWIEIEFLANAVLIIFVTPCVGVWIEILVSTAVSEEELVTPCVGVWIEIYRYLRRNSTIAYVTPRVEI